MKCLNKNIPAIKVLIDEFGEVQASKLLDTWQGASIPTVSELKAGNNLTSGLIKSTDKIIHRLGCRI